MKKKCKTTKALYKVFCTSKTFLIMRITMFLLLFSVIQVMGENSYSQNTRLSLNLKDVSIENVLDEIENQSEFYFLFNQKLVNVDRKVDINAKNKQIKDILTDLFADENVNYMVLDRQILLSPEYLTEGINVTRDRQPQEIVITGKVTEENSTPLPGVNILIKGTILGTITDVDGNYSIEVDDPNATLVFSFIGFRDQEIAISGRAVINITLAVEAFGLEEVVAIGYGTMKRKQVTSSIATVRVDDFTQGAIYQSPIELIAGKIGGLAISRAGGGDPTSDIQVQLRGISSIRGTASPLIVIDGIPGGDLNAISPENISSIDVLRDGSAAAIYGSRATNGVIIITTKKGTPGKPEIKYSAYTYTETWASKPKMLTANEYIHYKNEFTNSGDPYLVEKASNMIDYGNETDWFNVISRNALSHVHDISVTGGTESTQYYGSINFRDQQGLMKKSDKNVLNGRMSLTHSALDDKLLFQINISNSFVKSHPFDEETMAQAALRNPTEPVYSKDRIPGTEVLNPDGIYFEQRGHNIPNPLGLIEQFERDNEDSRFLGNINLTYKFTKGLKITTNAAYQRSNKIRSFYEERNSWYSLNATGYYGNASKSAYMRESRSIEPILEYSGRLENIHSFTILTGYSYQDFIDETFSASNRTFITDDFTYNNLGAGVAISRGNYASPVSSDKFTSKLIAFFGRLNYSYDDKYMLSASLRREGSSKFGANNKWGYFPAISAGWTVSREPFMNSIAFINDLKIRLGYGITGNHGIPSYLSLQRLSTSGTMLYEGEWIPGYAPASNANPNLGWEKKAEWNLGIDLRIFNTLFVNIDFYDRNTTDLLYEYAVPVPPNLYSKTWANVGKINNRGIELTLNAKPVSNSSFSWNTNFNISYNKNNLVSLSDENYSHSFLMLGDIDWVGMTGEYTYKLEEGQPIGNIFGWAFAGFTDDGRWQVWDKTGTKKLHPSEATFDDKKVIGNGLPKSWFGFSNTFKYNNFDLTIALKGALGFDILNSFRLGRENLGYLPNNLLRSTFTNPEISQIRDNRNYITDYHVEAGDYLKLDNITLGYTIPVKAINHLRIYANIRNLFCLTQYTGEDPEDVITGLVPGYDSWRSYPKVKTFTFGLNINF